MTQSENNSTALEAVELLIHYSFDLSGYPVAELVGYWLSHYPANWLRMAVIEALYQGRYKAVSVGQILLLWQRRGHPIYHFNHEFERMISGTFVNHQMTASLDPPTAPALESSTADLSGEEGTEIEVASELIITTSDENLGGSDLGGEDAIASPHPPFNVQAPGIQDLPPIRTFQPDADLLITPAERFTWLQLEAGKHPIHQFIPTSISSEFYSKLKSVAFQQEFSQKQPETI